MQDILKQALGLLARWLGDRYNQPKADPLDALKRLFALRGWPYGKGFNITLLLDYDNPNTYNDFLLVHSETELFKIRCTGEAGDWSKAKKKQKWYSAFLPGRYPGLYKAGTFRGKKALRMQKQIKLADIHNDYKPRLGGGCHIHGRASTKDTVDNSGGGCIVPYDGQPPVDLLHGMASARSTLPLCVAMLNEFPEISKVEDWKQWAKK